MKNNQKLKALLVLGAAFLLLPAVASAVPVVPATADVTVTFTNSADAPIAGAAVEYFAGGAWHNLGTGTTDASGVATMSGHPTTPANLKVRVSYEGRTATRTQNIRTNPDFDFATVLAQVRLEKQDTTGIAGGVVDYANNGTFVSFGTTDVTGVASKELLPGSYNVRMSYNGHRISRKANTAVTEVFTTVPVTLHSSTAITYNTKSPSQWTTFVGPTAELLPGSYTLRADGTPVNQRLLVVAGDSVEKTVFVVEALKENGNGFQDARASYVVDGNWFDIPYPTNGKGAVAWIHDGMVTSAHVRVELSDGGNYTQVNSVNLATNSTVTFNAHRVKVTLIDSTGKPLAGGNAYIHNSNDYLGATNSKGEVYADVFGASDKFRMEYEGTWKVMTAATTAPVTFQTQDVSMRLIDHNGNPLEGGVITHNGYFFGTTGTDGWAHNELFPGTVKVAAKYNRSVQSVANHPLATPITFQTGLLQTAGTASLIRASGSSGYTAFLGTEMELLPGNHSVKFIAPTTPTVQSVSVSAGAVTNIP